MEGFKTNLNNQIVCDDKIPQWRKKSNACKIYFNLKSTNTGK